MITHIDRDGKIGLGTTAPGSALHLVTNEPDESGGIRLERTVGIPGRYNFEIASTGDFGLTETAMSPRLKLQKTTGNVGVGTTTPQARLDVNGQINCTVLELTSDRNPKQGFTKVLGSEVLEKVSKLPIAKWQYTNAPAITHIGPTAQDFREAFDVGTDNKHIATVDADGVALAAIQELHRLVLEREKTIEVLQRRLEHFRK